MELPPLQPPDSPLNPDSLDPKLKVRSKEAVNCLRRARPKGLSENSFAIFDQDLLIFE